MDAGLRLTSERKNFIKIILSRINIAFCSFPDYSACMKIEQYNALVACERSGIVRDALIAMGIKAISCDVHSTQQPGPHWQGDVREILRLKHWKLLIAHPTCRYLTNAGTKHLYRRIEGKWSVNNGRDEDRWKKMREGAEFFRLFDRAEHIPCRAVENPIMHGHAVQLIGRKASQYVQPWWFGDPFKKATGLWLTGLPSLPREFELEWYKEHGIEVKQEVWLMGPSEDREEKRSRTYPQIARAFAQYWGKMLGNQAT